LEGYPAWQKSTVMLCLREMKDRKKAKKKKKKSSHTIFSCKGKKNNANYIAFP